MAAPGRYFATRVSVLPAACPAVQRSQVSSCRGRRVHACQEGWVAWPGCHHVPPTPAALSRRSLAPGSPHPAPARWCIPRSRSPPRPRLEGLAPARPLPSMTPRSTGFQIQHLGCRSNPVLPCSDLISVQTPNRMHLGCYGNTGPLSSASLALLWGGAGGLRPPAKEKGLRQARPSGWAGSQSLTPTPTCSLLGNPGSPPGAQAAGAMHVHGLGPIPG